MRDPNQPPQPAPYESAPIAAPDGRVAPLPAPVVTVQQGVYATAPQVVKIARLIAVLTALGGVAFLSAHSASGADFFLWSGIFLLAMGSWLAVGHTRGQSVAWSGQILLSVFSLVVFLLGFFLSVVGLGILPSFFLGSLAFPLGILIHAYLLALWFSPGVKVWYGRY